MTFLPRPLAVVVSLGLLSLVVGGATACVPTDGGCYEIQKDIVITPSESCLVITPDVCDAEDGTLAITNNCTDDLIVGGSATADGGAGTTVAAGQTVDVQVSAYASAGMTDYDVPATLGGTSITITYQLASSS